MKKVFADPAWKDYVYCPMQDRKILKRINDEHRMVYKVEGDDLLIAQLRFHY